MKLVFDTETTIFQKGNPFARRNRLCYIGYKLGDEEVVVGDDGLLGEFANHVSHASLLVGFNLKFDLHWIRRCGIRVDPKLTLWDCQYAHFLMTGQQVVYPSLDEVCQYWGLPTKVDKVRELWDQGIDTPDIDPELMKQYTTVDVELTGLIQRKQEEWFSQNELMYTLFRMHMVDTHVLAEMEWNGFKYDVDQSKIKGQETEKRIKEVEAELRRYSGDAPINFDSHDHISCLLYGGTIVSETRELVGEFKSGARKGLPRFKVVETLYPMPRLVDPIPNSEMAKEGFWKANDTILRQLKHPIVELLLERARLSKLLDYYYGLPELIEEKDWEPGVVHGQFNQCVARTGRLSSSEPNLQNQTEESLLFFKTCF